MDSFAPEEELVAALKSGDDRAFEFLVRRHGGRMMEVARRYLSEEDARDAVQEAFLSAFVSIRKFEQRSSIGTWLHRIVVNASLMRLRRSSKEEELLDTHVPSFGNDGKRIHTSPAWQLTAVDVSRSAEARDILRRALKKIPGTYRAVFILREIDGADTAAAAEALGITPNAVRIRLHRARQALREQLDAYMRETQS